MKMETMNEKYLFITFQRSFENYVKIRTARQTSPECNCPPGKLCVCVCARARLSNDVNSNDEDS